MSGGTDTPTHVYWDLENRKGLWARGEAMSETPTARELLDGSGQWAGGLLAARVEAVLVLHQPYGAAPQWCTGCARVVWPCPTRRALEGQL